MKKEITSGRGKISVASLDSVKKFMAMITVYTNGDIDIIRGASILFIYV